MSAHGFPAQPDTIADNRDFTRLPGEGQKQGASAKPAAALRAHDTMTTDDGSMQMSDGVPTYTKNRVLDKDPFATPTTAEDTMTGATSADVYQGLGKPFQGQTSNELHHDGMHGRKRQPVGNDWMQPQEPTERWEKE